MPGGTFTTAIRAPIDGVWAVVSDGEPNQVGATFHSMGAIPVNSHNGNDVEVTEWVEPTRFAHRSTDPLGVFVNGWDLRSTGRRQSRA